MRAGGDIQPLTGEAGNRAARRACADEDRPQIRIEGHAIARRGVTSDACFGYWTSRLHRNGHGADVAEGRPRRRRSRQQSL